jgi:hypothetical protein
VGLYLHCPIYFILYLSIGIRDAENKNKNHSLSKNIIQYKTLGYYME